MKFLTLLLILVLSFILLVFLYLNQGLVTIKYFPGEGHQTPPIPLFAVIMLAVIAGVVMAGLVGMGEQLRLRLKLRMLGKERDRTGQKLAELEEQTEPLTAVEPIAELPGEKPDQPSLQV